MNSLHLTLTDLVTDASRGWLASGINSELSLLPSVSIGWKIHATLHLRFIDLKLI